MGKNLWWLLRGRYYVSGASGQESDAMKDLEFDQA